MKHLNIIYLSILLLGFSNCQIENELSSEKFSFSEECSHLYTSTVLSFVSNKMTSKLDGGVWLLFEDGITLTSFGEQSEVIEQIDFNKNDVRFLPEFSKLLAVTKDKIAIGNNRHTMILNRSDGSVDRLIDLYSDKKNSLSLRTAYKELASGNSWPQHVREGNSKIVYFQRDYSFRSTGEFKFVVLDIGDNSQQELTVNIPIQEVNLISSINSNLLTPQFSWSDHFLFINFMISDSVFIINLETELTEEIKLSIPGHWVPSTQNFVKADASNYFPSRYPLVSTFAHWEEHNKYAVFIASPKTINGGSFFESRTFKMHLIDEHSLNVSKVNVPEESGGLYQINSELYLKCSNQESEEEYLGLKLLAE
ncbi:MAG: hypothetical protein HRU40_18125 [Saprospiraceae bacterium]|nr:hypothetical protein [Saprospiraceae bacterium]